MKGIGSRRPGEIAFAVVLLIFSGWAFLKSYQIDGFSSLSGPGVFPMLATGIMLVSATFILIKTLRQSIAQEESLVTFMSYLLPNKLIIFIPMVVAFAVTMPLIGFFLSAAAFIFLAISYLWRRNIIWSLSITALSVGVIYFVFRVLFQVILPQGVLWQ